MGGNILSSFASSVSAVNVISGEDSHRECDLQDGFDSVGMSLSGERVAVILVVDGERLVRLSRK